MINKNKFANVLASARAQTHLCRTIPVFTFILSNSLLTCKYYLLNAVPYSNATHHRQFIPRPSVRMCLLPMPTEMGFL